jgi:hypothetical protein
MAADARAVSTAGPIPAIAPRRTPGPMHDSRDNAEGGSDPEPPSARVLAPMARGRC